MSSRLVLASCPQMPQGDGDDAGLVEALAELGVEARWQPWGEQTAADETVVLRATWDYQDHLADFLNWCSQVPRLINPYPVVTYNTDKTYLTRLAAAGLPVIPSTVLAPGEDLGETADDFVLKPTVGAGSRGAARFDRTQREEAQLHLKTLHSQGFSVLLQPYQASVDKEGEVSLVFFRGRYSHAFTKGPMLTGGVVDTQGALYLEEHLAETSPEPKWQEIASDILRAAASEIGIPLEQLVFARVDLVRGADGPLLLELEMTEPGLGFPYVNPAALRRFARALADSCS
ncbi:RimK family alpha-L-glutamate ligase [Streptomyces sp. DSM 116496]|uniref:ATP-grasp domain-containing protein n=1 Tax=Streptomyces stoeckheimensis TaxID=3344656 RepID=UPI0038B2AAD6